MLIALLVTLNIYELAVIGLGIALSRSVTMVRDTRHLFALAMLLLVDTSFVYNETSIFKPEVGGVIAAVAVLLALMKGWWIVRSLGIRLTRSAAGAVASCWRRWFGMRLARDWAGESVRSRSRLAA